jgi:hypothetical protein
VLTATESVGSRVCSCILNSTFWLLLLLLLLQVVDGFEVVKAIETVGSRSGATSYEVVVADCGSLPKGECGAAGLF